MPIDREVYISEPPNAGSLEAYDVYSAFERDDDCQYVVLEGSVRNTSSEEWRFGDGALTSQFSLYPSSFFYVAGDENSFYETVICGVEEDGTNFDNVSVPAGAERNFIIVSTIPREYNETVPTGSAFYWTCDANFQSTPITSGFSGSTIRSDGGGDYVYCYEFLNRSKILAVRHGPAAAARPTQRVHAPITIHRAQIPSSR